MISTLGRGLPVYLVWPWRSAFQLRQQDAPGEPEVTIRTGKAWTVLLKSTV